MSIINKYRATEELIKDLKNQLQALSQSTELKNELEFEEKLRALMSQYNKSLRDINALLDPKSVTGTATTSIRKPRKTKRYVNPHTGDVIETKGGNHKQLKEWKSQWGADTVESWATILD